MLEQRESCKHDAQLANDWTAVHRSRSSLPYLRQGANAILIGGSLSGMSWYRGILATEPWRHERHHVTFSRAEQEFAELSQKWKHETQHVSSTVQIVMHPTYQSIIGMGREVVPIILRELKQSQHHWFWALVSITRENPVQKEDAGNLPKMTAAWIKWGRDRGII